MLIQDSRIGAKEFKLQGEISPENAEAYLQETAYARAKTPIQYQAVLRRTKKNIALEADIQADIVHTCDRCCGTFEKSYQFRIALALIEATALDRKNNDEITLEADDLDTVTYENHQIDIDQILLESLYLEFDSPCLCSDGCRGICPVCRQNLNTNPCSCKIPEFT